MNAADERVSKPKKSRAFLALYIIALFSAAAVIILISYLYSTRIEQSEEELAETKQLSVSALQSVENLQEENISLQERLAAATEQIAELESELIEYKVLLDEQKDKTRNVVNMLHDKQKELDDMTVKYNELLQGEDAND